MLPSKGFKCLKMGLPYFNDTCDDSKNNGLPAGRLAQLVRAWC